MKIHETWWKMEVEDGKHDLFHDLDWFSASMFFGIWLGCLELVVQPYQRDDWLKWVLSLGWVKATNTGKNNVNNTAGWDRYWVLLIGSRLDLGGCRCLFVSIFVCPWLFLVPSAHGCISVLVGHIFNGGRSHPNLAGLHTHNFGWSFSILKAPFL